MPSGFRTRFRNVSGQFFRFGVVGCVGFVVDAAVLYACLGIGAGHYLGRVISYLFAASTTFFLNRKFTFGISGKDNIASQWFRFLVVNLSGGIANLAVYAFLVTYIRFFFDYPVFAVGIGSLSGMLLNFIFSKKLVFQTQPKG